MPPGEEYRQSEAVHYVEEPPDLRLTAAKSLAGWMMNHAPEQLDEIIAVTLGVKPGEEASWITQEANRQIYDAECESACNKKLDNASTAGVLFNEFQKLKRTLEGTLLADEAAHVLMRDLNRPAADALREPVSKSVMFTARTGTTVREPPENCSPSVGTPSTTSAPRH